MKIKTQLSSILFLTLAVVLLLPCQATYAQNPKECFKISEETPEIEQTLCAQHGSDLVDINISGGGGQVF
jgi:hypothetical protein